MAEEGGGRFYTLLLLPVCFAGGMGLLWQRGGKSAMGAERRPSWLGSAQHCSVAEVWLLAVWKRLVGVYFHFSVFLLVFEHLKCKEMKTMNKLWLKWNVCIYHYCQGKTLIMSTFSETANSLVYCITTMHFWVYPMGFERVSLAQACIIFSTHRDQYDPLIGV